MSLVPRLVHHSIGCRVSAKESHNEENLQISLATLQLFCWFSAQQLRIITVRMPVWFALLLQALALAECWLEERPWMKDVLAAGTLTPTLEPGGSGSMSLLEIKLAGTHLSTFHYSVHLQYRRNV